MASLLWKSVFVFLLLELALTLILVMPVPRKVRNWICRETAHLNLKKRLQTPLLFVGLALTLALLDCFSFLQLIFEREQEGHELPVQAYTGNEGVMHQLDKEKEYKTERNIYLAGFALTLLLVIGRLTDLMQEHADLEDDLEKIRLSSKPVDDSATTTTGEAGVVEIEMKPIKKKPVEKKND